MNKKFVPAVVVALIAVTFAVFVAVNNSGDTANTKDIKGASTSQPSKAAKPAKTETVLVSTSAPQGDDSSNDDQSGSVGIPADQRSRKTNGVANVLAIVTKPVDAAPAPVVVADAPTPTPTPTPVPTPTPTPTPVLASNLVANPSVEDSTNNVPTAWTAGGFGVNAGASTYAVTGRTGTHSLQVDITSYTDGDAKWVSNQIPVTAGKTYQISDFYKSVGTSEVDVAYMADGVATTYAQLGAAAAVADWAEFKSQFTVPVGITSVAIFHSLTSVGSLSTDDYSVVEGASTTPTPTPTPTPVPAPGVGFTGGRVSLTFDDGLASTAANGFPLLQKYGFVSTQYWISDTIKNNADYGTGYMTLAQAQGFLASMPGTEVAGHTMHHCSLVSATTTDDAVNCLTNLGATEQAAQNDRELNVGLADLRALFPGSSITDFASPYGSYDAASIAQIKAAGFASHRSTDAGFNTFGAFDPYNIMVQNVEAATTPQQVQAWVDQAIATNTWLVLVYHDVDTTAGAFGVSTANFEAELKYISDSKVKVETVSQALAGN